MGIYGIWFSILLCVGWFLYISFKPVVEATEQHRIDKERHIFPKEPKKIDGFKSAIIGDDAKYEECVEFATKHYDDVVADLMDDIISCVPDDRRDVFLCALNPKSGFGFSQRYPERSWQFYRDELGLNYDWDVYRRQKVSKKYGDNKNYCHIGLLWYACKFGMIPPKFSFMFEIDDDKKFWRKEQMSFDVYIWFMRLWEFEMQKHNEDVFMVSKQFNPSVAGFNQETLKRFDPMAKIHRHYSTTIDKAEIGFAQALPYEITDGLRNGETFLCPEGLLSPIDIKHIEERKKRRANGLNY